MTSLFPTFTSWLQRAKRFLATDSRDIWQRAREAIEADEEWYQQQLQAKGIDLVIYPSFVTLVRVKYFCSCDSIHPEHKR